MISGAYSLGITGAVILTGANTYTGSTTIAAGGVLTLGDGGPTGSIPGAISDNGTLAIDQSGSVTLNNVSGTGALLQEGHGTTTLGTGISYSGGTSITAGTLAVGNAAELGTGALKINGGEFLASASQTISARAQSRLRVVRQLPRRPGRRSRSMQRAWTSTPTR